MSVAVLFPVFGSGTPFGDVTVAVSTIEPVADALSRKYFAGSSVRISYTDRCDEGNLVQLTHERWVMPNIC